MDASFQQAIETASKALAGGRSIRMPSAAGHDAQILSTIMPSGMLFVPSIGGISQRMLTVTLRGLERDGIVTRTVYPVVPPRVDYALTPLGETLLDTVCSLMTWAEAHRSDIDAARARYDERGEGVDY